MHLQQRKYRLPLNQPLINIDLLPKTLRASPASKMCKIYRIFRRHQRSGVTQISIRKTFAIIGLDTKKKQPKNTEGSCTSHNYYAALLPRRGPHIASHSVCPSVCLSVCPSVCPSVPLPDVVLLFYSKTVLRANIQNRKTSVFAYGPTSRMYFSARAEGRISYGHLGRTNLL